MNARTETNAALFRRLHHAESLLVLVNAWDAGTARLIESLGAPAIATTSAGVAWSHGYPDGDALPVPLLLATVSAIARVIRAPLTVDIEGGYSDDLDGVAATVAGVIDAGGVGINIEDGTAPPELLCAKIGRIREVAARLGVDLFVNARADVYLRGLGPEAGRVEETLRRTQLYRAAGADGIFVPGLTDTAAIAAISKDAGLPLNLLARKGLPAAAELKKLGVQRLSAGSGVTQAVFGRAASLASAFLQDGRSEPLADSAMTHPEINALLAG